jgi:flagellar hook-length control protein FliK
MATHTNAPDPAVAEPATAPPTPVIKAVHRSPQPLRPLDHDAPLAVTSPSAAPVAQLPGNAAPVAVAPSTAPPAGAPIDPQPALTNSLARLRQHGDGSHELTVQLHPAELGAVNISAVIRDGQLTVTVACADDAARAAVTAALPALHQQLSSAGFGGVDVHFGGPSHGQHDAPDKQQPTSQDRPERDERPREPVLASRTNRRSSSERALDRLL